MRRKTVLARLLCLCLALLLLPMVPARAAEAHSAPVQTSNLGDYDYAYDRWANPIKSHLADNGDGTFTRVEYTGETVTVERYDSALQFVSGQTIAMELPSFGGFHCGSEYNFLVFGQENPNEDDTAEVIRVVCYTKDWQRVGAASLCGANTTVPFDAGCLRFAEYNGYLYIRTAHEMYMSDDGRNHQSNLTMNVRIADMVITDSFWEVMNIRYGYVSHSFNQFIAVDGTELVAVDHGDANPRSVVLTRYLAPAGQDKFMVPTMEPVGDGYYRYVYTQNADILPIMGTSGDNDTGVSLGGFQISGENYLVAGTTVAQDDTYDPDGQRNIFISVTPKTGFPDGTTTLEYLTAYSSDDDVSLSNPHFVKVGEDRYAILWVESGSQLRYAFVDGSGKLTGEVYSAVGVLSDCVPIVSGGKLIWYVTSVSAPAFFTIDLENPENLTSGHVYTYSYGSYPGYSTPGKLTCVCALCGEAGADVVIPAIKGSDEYTVYRVDTAPTCTDDGYGYYSWIYLENYDVPQYIFGGTIPALGHDYVDGVCSRCGVEDPDAVKLFSLVGASMTLGNELAMNFYVKTADLEGTDYYAEIVKTYADGRDNKVVTVPYDQWKVNGSNRFFTFNGLAAKEMADEIYVTIYNSDGTQASEVWEDSVSAYVKRNIAKWTGETLTMGIDMLNYGAAAQEFFGYNEADLANSGLEEYQQYATPDVACVDTRVKGTNYVGSTLGLESSILLTMYFNNISPDMYAVVTFTDHYGNAKSVTIPGSEFKANGSRYGVVINALAVADSSVPVTCKVYNTEGDEVAGAVDSVESYVARMSSLDPLFQRIMNFSVGAYNHFH